METLILNSRSEEDLKLLLDTAKKLGLDVRVADRQALIVARAKLLNNSVKPNTLSFLEIVESCRSVRYSGHEKLSKKTQK